jgi:hypothetical protein
MVCGDSLLATTKELFGRDTLFTATILNPPFLGNISGAFGADYLKSIQARYPGCGGRCDFAIYFLRRAYEITAPGGTVAIISTKTIAEGDSRNGGLRIIVRDGGIIYDANTNMPWPGVANVRISTVCIRKPSPCEQVVLRDEFARAVASGDEDSALSIAKRITLETPPLAWRLLDEIDLTPEWEHGWEHVRLQIIERAYHLVEFIQRERERGGLDTPATYRLVFGTVEQFGYLKEYWTKVRIFVGVHHRDDVEIIRHKVAAGFTRKAKPLPVYTCAPFDPGSAEPVDEAAE